VNGDGIDLIDEELTLIREEVDPRHATHTRHLHDVAPYSSISFACPSAARR